ncbi:uncharacterized protein Z520_12255 [Fonsecaea multimorphosa CBS 102226]|uniref:Diacetyl reductase [(S)-acetoin forming] n=1 Tax=Fonsecaea multimorphosa CBS 102226 TaxID=1442371 RepID=A0A0D2JNH4_9EURO|nr:uncharacterized protein Z520_12255 [Fonsecaea multimorphosa CBS 102226]KIX92039.1 hypothetical protein Z520_12255 [Fonsecaea multimorphosa CBS 102226]OAL17407.1 hypothetical protein AYO22_11688 [Fonsecaea multimorphosa]
MVVATVTGSSRGIGRAIALQLADDGMDIALNDVQAQLPQLQAVKAEIEKKGRKASTFVADVSNEEQVQKMVADIVTEFGELNVMVANAGIFIPKSIMEVSVAEWDRIMAINVRGVYLCYREAAKQMIKQGKGGKMVAACSTAGYRPSASHSAAYTTSKWAVRGLTQTAAVEFAKYDINMWKLIDADIANREGLQPGVAFERSVQARAALKRAQDPEDIANLVSFLVSTKARNITGQSVLCDGGERHPSPSSTPTSGPLVFIPGCSDQS